MAAEQGETEAQNRLALLFSNGKVVQQENPEA
jgi:TPR repeat protein